MSTILAKRMATARKEHRCCECGGSIEKGERYERAAGLSDGRWSLYRTCRACLSIIADRFSGKRPPFGQLEKAIRRGFPPATTERSDSCQT